MKHIWKIFIYSVLLCPYFYSQTIDLDNHKVNIGDSFQIVKKQFDPKIYHWVTDSSDFKNWTYLNKYTPKQGGEVPIAQLDFSFDERDFLSSKHLLYQYYLHSVMKYYDDNVKHNDGSNEFAQRIFNLIDKNGIDNYAAEVKTTKFSMNGEDSKSISLKIRPNVLIKIEFNGGNNCIVSETTSAAEDTAYYRYVLVYYDMNNLIGKEKIVYADFHTYKEAEMKLMECDLPYIKKGFPPQQSKIIRFLDR